MKRIICALLTALCVFSLVGCKIEECVVVDIERSGKAEIRCELICDEEAYELIGDYEVKDPWSEFEKEKRGEKTYYVSSYVINTDSLEDTVKSLSEMTYGADRKIDMFSDVDISDNLLSLTLNPFKTDASSETDTVNSVYDVKLTFKTPYKITEYNKGELSDDGKELTVTVKSPTKGQEITAVLDYEPLFLSVIKLIGKAVLFIVLSALLILAAVFGAIYTKKLISHKKNKNSSIENTDTERNFENENSQEHIND